MIRRLCRVLVCLAVPVTALAQAPAEPQNFSIDPWHIQVPKPLADPVTSVAEPLTGSEVTAEITFVEMRDGVYSPIAVMKPRGTGRFPTVVLAHMNGGGGTRWLREWLHYGNWTPEQLVKAGYAVVWMRYRAEIDNTYGPAIKESTRQGRKMFNRGPFEYDDAIDIIEFLKKQAYVDPARVGYLGLSHGGEMLFKINSEYQGLRCGIAVEPAASEYLAMRRKPAGSPQIPETRMDVTEAMLLAEKNEARTRIDMPVAMARINRIATPMLVVGRINDDNMPSFRLGFELAREAGKPVEWKQYPHPEHGFIFVRRNAKGVYDPDAVQRQSVADAITYFDGCLKR